MNIVHGLFIMTIVTNISILVGAALAAVFQLVRGRNGRNAIRTLVFVCAPCLLVLVVLLEITIVFLPPPLHASLDWDIQSRWSLLSTIAGIIIRLFAQAITTPIANPLVTIWILAFVYLGWRLSSVGWYQEAESTNDR